MTNARAFSQSAPAQPCAFDVLLCSTVAITESSQSSNVEQHSLTADAAGSRSAEIHRARS